MSLSNNHGSGSRSSIFETFHTPNFGDENFEMQPMTVNQPQKTYSKQSLITTATPSVASGIMTTKIGSGATVLFQNPEEKEVEQEVEDDEEEEEEEEILDDEGDESSNENVDTTLWMSCSPGRDLTDEEEEDGEEDRGRDEMLEEAEEDEEEQGQEKFDESSDDGLPLAKLAGKHFLHRDHPGAKRFKPNKNAKPLKDKKAPKKQLAVAMKTKKDPNAPKRPLTAYAFFYRDTQNAIKSQNPQATFGEISKIVASMWDRLDGELKEEYNKRAEESKQEYIKKLAEYCATNKVESVKTKVKKTKKLSKPAKRKPAEPGSPSGSQDGVEEMMSKDETDNADLDAADASDTPDSPDGNKRHVGDEKPRPICNYTKCQNPAVDDPRWEYNYCSSQCVIDHCKDVFRAWVANRKSTYCET